MHCSYDLRRFRIQYSISVEQPELQDLPLVTYNSNRSYSTQNRGKSLGNAGVQACVFNGVEENLVGLPNDP